MTIGEANSEDRLSRGCLWARAVFAPSLLLFAFALGLTYAMYRSVDAGGEACWRLLVMVSLRDAGRRDPELHEPVPAVAARNALLVVYAVGGVFLMAIGCQFFAYGHASAFIALGFILAAALAGLMAFWLWLDRTYRSVH